MFRLLLLLLIAPVSFAATTIYKCENGDGKVVYSDQACEIESTTEEIQVSDGSGGLGGFSQEAHDTVMAALDGRISDMHKTAHNRRVNGALSSQLRGHENEIASLEATRSRFNDDGFVDRMIRQEKESARQARVNAAAARAAYPD